ncbi:MAG: transposase [Deltaproteobacteria bacterium]|nr:transposase [Deltaproteobacteria bacterium]MBN2674711.1 transposase [Deltaproteobacteria bacterium]
MPRTARLDAPGILHHVRGRGVERKKIFLNDYDRRDFLGRLEAACEGGAATIYAWSLMPNHFHLAIRTGDSPLSQTMRKLLTGYAVSFNRRNNRSGHLFQNRYKSTVVDEERYFLGLVRYIHLNPVRARMVDSVADLKSYPWTGHRQLMGKGGLSVQDVDTVLGRFGATVGAARRELVRFMEMDEERAERKMFKGGGLIRSAGGIEALQEMAKEKWAHDDRILGSGSFVEFVLKQAEADIPLQTVSLQERYALLEKVVGQICSQADLRLDELTGGGRRKEIVVARQVICYVGVKQIGLSAAAISRYLNISKMSASTGVQKGKERIAEYEICL